MHNSEKLKAPNLIPDILIFIIGCLLQFFVVYWCVPMLNRTGIMPIGSWMILSIPLIFIPIIIGGYIMQRKKY